MGNHQIFQKNPTCKKRVEKNIKNVKRKKREKRKIYIKINENGKSRREVYSNKFICSKKDLKQTSFTSQGIRKIKHTTKPKVSRKKETTNIEWK